MRKRFIKKKVLLSLCLGSMAIMHPAYADITETGYQVTGNVTDNSTRDISIIRTVADTIYIYGIANNGSNNFNFSNPAMITLGATSTTSYASARGIYNWGSTTLGSDADITVTAAGGNAALAYATAFGVFNGVTVHINGDADIAARASGGSATSTNSDAYASASAYGLYKTGDGSTSISGNADIMVTAIGGNSTSTFADIQAGANSDAEAYGITTTGGYNSYGSTNISGDADVKVTAAGGHAASTYSRASAEASADGIYSYGSTSISGDTDITVAVTGGSAMSSSSLLYSFNNACAYASANGLDNIGSTSISGDTDIRVTATGGSATATNMNAEVSAYASANGLNNIGSTSISGDTDIRVTATGGSTTAMNNAEVSAYASAKGIYNMNGSTSISGDTNIAVTAIGGNATDATAYGINNENGTVDLGKNLAIIATATANNGNASAYSLYASGGTISINQAAGNPYKVKLIGDVRAMDSGKVKLNLNGSSSFLRGNVVTSGSGTIYLTLANNAVWEPVYDNRNGTIAYDPAKYSVNTNTISSLKLSGGIVDLTWDDRARTAYRQLSIGSLSGTGGALRINTDVANNIGDRVQIGTLSSDAKLNVAVNDDPSLAAITAPTTLYTSSNYSPVHVAAGEEYLTVAGVTTDRGAYSVTPHFTGTNLTSLAIDASTNTKAAAGVTSGQAQLMQTSVNHLRKRLGDLRQSPVAETGIWARVYTGEVSNDKYGKVESDYRGTQIGYDKSAPAAASGRKYLGGAASFTSADNSFTRGIGDSRAYDFALYQTWIGKNGHYYDVIAKHGRLSSAYHVTDLNGDYAKADYHTSTDSISAEYGYRKQLINGWYLEPQAELTWGHIRGVDYITSSGMNVRQDGIDRLIGRVGIGGGKKLAHGNHLYSSLSLLHEFKGSQIIQADTLTYNQDMGGSWYEFILGGTAKLSDHSDGYFNVEKLFGGHVSSNWQVNAGCRFNF